MAYHIYTTPGFVIDSRPNGEAGKMLYIFTRDLGLVIASAQGIRLSASKLRYHTQDFSYGIFSLVRGKEMWRLTGATPASELEGSTDKTSLTARIFALLRRLLNGEEKNEALFATLLAFMEYQQRSQLSEEEASLVECIVVLRILHALGYLKESTELSPFLGDMTWSPEVLEAMKPLRSAAIREINAGIQASQL